MLFLNLQSDWKSIIDPRLKVANKTNWYLNNKLSFGSTNFIGKRILIFYIISCVISISIWYAADIIGYTMAALTDLLVFSGILYIYFYVNQFYVKCVMNNSSIYIILLSIPKNTENW